jgi:MYXO-CTERM domain-containing protein
LLAALVAAGLVTGGGPARSAPIAAGPAQVVGNCFLVGDAGLLDEDPITDFGTSSIAGALAGTPYDCSWSPSAAGPRIDAHLELDADPVPAGLLGLQAGGQIFYEYAVNPTGALPPGVTTVPILADVAGAVDLALSGGASGSASVSVLLSTEGPSIGGGAATTSDVSCTVSGTCSFMRTVMGEVLPETTYGVVLRADLAVDVTSGAGGGTSSGWVDPVIRVDPEATFGAGERYADFFEVTVSPRVVQGVPEPGVAALGLAAAAAAGRLRRRRGEAPPHA